MTVENTPEEQLHAAAIQWLLEGGTDDDLFAASLLLACKLELEYVEQTHSYSGAGYVDIFRVSLIGPRQAVEEINRQKVVETADKKKKDSPGKKVADAFQSVQLPYENMAIAGVDAVGGFVENLDSEWWDRTREYLKTGGVTNQGWYRPDEVKGSVPTVWNMLRFRSITEREIAKALEKANVMFFPGSKARLEDITGKRIMREPDFLVFHNEVWGILEVDGAFGHTGRAVKDHERDRAFRRYGIPVERYSAERCYKEPDRVVAEFLDVIAKSRNA